MKDAQPLQTWSPDWVTAQLDKRMAEDFNSWQSFAASSRAKRVGFFIFGALLSAALFYAYKYAGHFFGRYNRFSSNFILFNGGLICAVPLFAYLAQTGLRWTRWLYSALCMAGLLGGPILAELANERALSSSSLSVATAILPPLFMFALVVFFKIRGAFAQVLVLAGVLIAIALETYWSSLNAIELIFVWHLIFLERFSMPLTVLVAERNAGLQTASLSELCDYFTSPAYYLFPLPLRSRIVSRTLKAANDTFELACRGASDFMMAVVGFAAAIGVGWLRAQAKIPVEPTRVEAWQVAVGGLLTYLSFYCNSFAWVRIATGVCRWFGYGVMDGYHFPLLAATPIERWRRWNTYFYEWSRSFVFFPVMKLLRSPLLACLATFFVTFLEHQSLAIFGDLRHENFKSISFLEHYFFFFMAHGLVIWVALLTARFWPSGSRRAGWWGVLATLCLMTAVHAIVMYH